MEGHVRSCTDRCDQDDNSGLRSREFLTSDELYHDNKDSSNSKRSDLVHKVRPADDLFWSHHKVRTADPQRSVVLLIDQYWERGPNASPDPYKFLVDSIACMLYSILNKVPIGPARKAGLLVVGLYWRSHPILIPGHDKVAHRRCWAEAAFLGDVALKAGGTVCLSDAWSISSVSKPERHTCHAEGYSFPATLRKDSISWAGNVLDEMLWIITPETRDMKWLDSATARRTSSSHIACKLIWALNSTWHETGSLAFSVTSCADEAPLQYIRAGSAVQPKMNVFVFQTRQELLSAIL
ncbi:hypothetical protein An07g01240 [Aspergillus niger]|uniref:Uncharacterized protein n=2 Tax=Aspergillus niger TaxID=5061 RepID=A2QM90_ASPNC|nr:hypothetical protein An07g01240 [Aspergillus niger]CAK96571.1 hypothetical protein An07g01240 [Aspergillus niger]